MSKLIHKRCAAIDFRFSEISEDLRNFGVTCRRVRRNEARDDIILIATKPFQRAEAIVLKPLLNIDVGNDAPERRTWALKTGDDIQCSIFMDSS